MNSARIEGCDSDSRMVESLGGEGLGELVKEGRSREWARIALAGAWFAQSF